MSDEGYEFIPLPDRVRRAPRPEARHDKRVDGSITADISLRLVTEQPLHVGSGFKTLRDGQVARAAVTSAGAPCVPGSTLKGVLRSRFEAITRSCALFRENDRAVKVRSSSYPGAKARFTRTVAGQDAFQPCGERDGTCAACALFGRMSLRGRVAVSDFTSSEPVKLELAEIAEMFSPNLHHVGAFTPQDERGETMLVVSKLHGRKFARGRGPEAQGRERIEVIPAGASLQGDLRLTNVTPAELGGLLAALGVRPESRLKVGAGKGHGFGRVRAADLSIRVRFGAAASDVTAYEQAFRACPDAWLEGLDALVKIHAEARHP